jgi:uncharacterized protein (DUF885 family)
MRPIPGIIFSLSFNSNIPAASDASLRIRFFTRAGQCACEKLAVEHGLVDIPGAELIQIHDSLWRAHRIVIDCGLHDGTLSHAAAAKRLQAGVGFTAARAKADVNRYTSSPTVPMSYLLGGSRWRNFIAGS